MLEMTISQAMTLQDTTTSWMLPAWCSTLAETVLGKTHRLIMGSTPDLVACLSKFPAWMGFCRVNCVFTPELSCFLQCLLRECEAVRWLLSCSPLHLWALEDWCICQVSQLYRRLIRHLTRWVAFTTPIRWTPITHPTGAGELNLCWEDPSPVADAAATQ